MQLRVRIIGGTKANVLAGISSSQACM